MTAGQRWGLGGRAGGERLPAAATAHWLGQEMWICRGVGLSACVSAAFASTRRLSSIMTGHLKLVRHGGPRRLNSAEGRDGEGEGGRERKGGREGSGRGEVDEGGERSGSGRLRDVA